MAQSDLFSKYKRGLFVGLGAGAVFYLVYSLTAEVPKVMEHLRTFQWWLLLPVLLLSLSNYLIRFLRWEFYLRRLELRLPLGKSLAIFLAGLAMTITPGKAGELLKSLLIKEELGTPIMRSAPVVVAERLTDFLALVLLTSLGIGTWYSEHWGAIAAAGAGLVAIILLLNSRSLSMGLIAIFGKFPVVGGFAPRLEEAYLSTASLLSFRPLVIGVSLATLAWFAECLGYYTVFNGHGVHASLLLSTFLYAFSTIAGVISPGGLGVTDLSLGEGAVLLIPGMTDSLAVSAAFIIRLCTLWFAVLVGSLALMRFKGSALIQSDEGSADASAVSADASAVSADASAVSADASAVSADASAVSADASAVSAEAAE